MTEHAAPPMPQPTAEHVRMKELVGTWKVHCTFYMEPGAPPMECEAKETVEMLGDWWILSKFESNMMGMPFHGRAMLGYEPHARRYVSTWIDSMAPAFFAFTGSEKGDTLTMTAKAFSCMTNSELLHRTTEKRIGKNERIFEMFCTLPDGAEIKIMTNHYRRA